MGLNPRGRGRGRGKGTFQNKGRRGGGMGGGQGPMFRAGPHGMFCPPPMGFPPEPPFGGPFFPGPSGFNFGPPPPPRPGFGKFPRKNFKRKVQQKNTETPAPEIDLTKPWVTDEIKAEDSKKQECLETWRKSKDDGDWSKYKAQKQVVKDLYDKAKEEYIANHPNEDHLWQTSGTTARSYYCETCDKSFKTDDGLILHVEEHETCGRDGCEFTAHPKIIAKHVRMQHDTGLYKRIGKLYTEDEIKKWIEERKKRYPSRKVIEEKKALELEKQNRGEKIKEDKSAFNKDFQNRGRNGKKANCDVRSGTKKAKEKIQRNRRQKKKKKSILGSYSIEGEISSQSRGIPAFAGIGDDALSDRENDEPAIDISDDEWAQVLPGTQAESATTTAVPQLLNGSLVLLASAYDSNSDMETGDDGNGPPEEVKTVTSRTCPQVKEEEEEADGNGEKTQTGNGSVKASNTDKWTRHSRNGCDDYDTRTLTLLEKLLRNEIRHERNVILQCVHHVVKNNFFGVT